VDGFCASHHPEGFIPAGHLGPLSGRLADWADTAARYAGVPYLWGGRSADGIDCSGLVQVALGLAGHPVPRDSPDQAREIGTGLPADSALKRGDLVFLPGHVAIMLDGEHAVHASSDPMAVVIEPIAAIAARITAREGAGITGVRRP
jgi:cell wall-associated NlpC family hydrolase